MHVEMRSLNHEWCIYGWKEGAAHRFFGPANATHLWSVKKVSPQHMFNPPRSRWNWPAAPWSIPPSLARTCWTCSGARA